MNPTPQQAGFITRLETLDNGYLVEVRMLGTRNFEYRILSPNNGIVESGHRTSYARALNKARSGANEHFDWLRNN